MLFESRKLDLFWTIITSLNGILEYLTLSSTKDGLKILPGTEYHTNRFSAEVDRGRINQNIKLDYRKYV